MITERYGDDVQVLMVNTDEPYETAWQFAYNSGVTSPVLLDEGGAVYGSYDLTAQQAYAPFPVHVVVDPEGTITYLNRQYDASALTYALDQALAE